MKTKTKTQINAPQNYASHKSARTRKSPLIWWKAFRYHFVPSSFLPAILGGVVAWTQTGIIYHWFFFLVVLGVTLNHIALNMTDDYFDYHAAVDQKNKKVINPYAGGSGTLTSGKIKPQDMRFVFISFYLLTIIIGLYLCAARTWWVLAFGVFGMASSYFYTAPPIRYGYRGFGEISQLVNFSFTIGMGAYVVQAGSISGEAFWVLSPLGLMMFAMIIINEIPDRRADAAAGKNNLVVLLGAKKAICFYAAAMTAAYIVILFAPIFNVASFWIYLAFLTVPWFLRAFGILKRNFSDPLRLAPANLFTIRAHNLTGILLIIAYLIQGIQNNHDVHHAFFAALILAGFYIPAAVSVFFKKPGNN
ncbi:MAG: prenyltransferase [Syntrophaceae bacterium]|nr:prenyltransferase [Syntrophaceae bacterium]